MVANQQSLRPPTQRVTHLTICRQKIQKYGIFVYNCPQIINHHLSYDGINTKFSYQLSHSD